MEERWEEATYAKGYLISNLGRLMSYRRRKQTGKILKPCLTIDGYEFYRLKENGTTFTKRAHRLVAESFIPNPDNKPEVNHIDGIKTNNRVENLEWVNGTENQQHAFKLGLKNHFGSNNPRARLLLNTQTGIFYGSAIEAAETISLHPQKLRDMLCGQIKNKTNFIYA